MIKILEVNYHRNGVGGTGFHAVLFAEDARAKVAKVGIVFPERGHVAVLDIALLSTAGVGVNNRWRGDEYEPALREAVFAYETKQSSLSALPDEEQRDLLYGKHKCSPFTRDGGLIIAEEKYGTCSLCGVRVDEQELK